MAERKKQWAPGNLGLRLTGWWTLRVQFLSQLQFLVVAIVPKAVF